MLHVTFHGQQCVVVPVKDIKLLKTDVDLHMMLYLNEEAGGKEKNTLFIISHEQIVELEHSISEFRKVEAQSLRALHDASSSRDRAARQSSMQVPPPCRCGCCHATVDRLATFCFEQRF